MHRLRLPLLLLLACIASVAAAQSNYRQLVVAEPYLEMHTGPGKGYPVFFVVARADQVDVLKERTGWYLVREHQGREGWVSEQDLALTQELDGSPAKLDIPTLEKITKHRWQGAVMLGDFGGATVVSLTTAYGLTDHLSVQLSLNHALGNISNSEFATLDVMHTLFPDWRVSPFVVMGTGYIHNAPHSTQVRSVDSTDQMSFIGGGVRVYISRRFMTRAEYHNNYTYTSRNENEVNREWKAGFAFFF